MYIKVLHIPSIPTLSAHRYHTCYHTDIHIYYLKGAHRVLARAHVAQSDDARADGEADVGAKGPCQRKKKTKNILLGKILIVFSLLFLKSRARTASFFLSFFFDFFCFEFFFFEVAR